MILTLTSFLNGQSFLSVSVEINCSLLNSVLSLSVSDCLFHMSWRLQVSFAVDGVLLLASLSILKALLEVLIHFVINL